VTADLTTDELRARVATACRLIGMEGFTDLTLGHVSARHPGERTIWIKRKGLALDEVEPDDVIALDLDDPHAFENRDYHLESVMHVGVYRARPDVNSVIHGHPTYGTALGATDGQLRLLTHDAVLFTDGLGVFEDGPALVTEIGQAERVAAALGHRRAALLRNHGVVVAGEDLRWSVLTAITLERAIRFQVIAASLGAPHPIPQADAELLRPMKYQESLLDDYWASWERRVARQRAAGGGRA
jgi:L-fuculose-phosphate aldolase